MTTPLEVTYAVHLLFAGLWAGAVVFVTVGVLPIARAGSIEPKPLETAFARLRTLSRGSALVVFLTGGYMAGQVYSVETLTNSRNGVLVLAMIVLWLLLAATVEIGAGRISDGVADRKVRDPARSATPIYQVASVTSVFLLIIGGVLSV